MRLVYISNFERIDSMLFILEKIIFLKLIKFDKISQDADILMQFKHDSMLYVYIAIEEQHVISLYYMFWLKQFNTFYFYRFLF